VSLFFSILSKGQTVALAHMLNGSNDVFPQKMVSGQTVALAHMLNGSNDVFPQKKMPFGVKMKGDAI